MKTVFLLRHAKSSWAEPGLGDDERPLNKRGRQDAPRMGRRFDQLNHKVGRVILSPARRAQQTFRLFSEAGNIHWPEPDTDNTLYFQGPQEIQNLVRAQDNIHATLLLVFHNPDITRIANLARGNRINNIPTCGILQLSAEIDEWRQWSWAGSEAVFFDFPKNRDD